MASSKRVVAGGEPAGRALALEGPPDQIPFELRLLVGGEVVLHLGDGIGAGGGRAGLEDIAQALDHAQQRGVVLVLHIEGVGHVVDQPLGELAGVGEALVERLDLLLQRLHGLQALLAHGPERHLEGVARRIGGDGAQETLELIGGDEGEGAGEEVDAAAAGAEGGRHEVPQRLVHDAVAGIERAAGDHAAALPEVGGGGGVVDQGVEHGVELGGEAVGGRGGTGQAERRRSKSAVCAAGPVHSAPPPLANASLLARASPCRTCNSAAGSIRQRLGQCAGGQCQVCGNGPGAGVGVRADPAGVHGGAHDPLLELGEGQESLREGHQGIGRPGEKERGRGDHPEGLRLAAVTAEGGKHAPGQRRPVEGHRQHPKPVAFREHREERCLGLTVGAVGAEEEEQPRLRRRWR